MNRVEVLWTKVLAMVLCCGAVWFLTPSVTGAQQGSRFGNVSSWSGTFSVTGGGSGTFEGETWVLSQSVTGTLNLTCLPGGGGCGCGGAIATSCAALGTSITANISDSLTVPGAFGPLKYTWTAGGSYTPQYVSLFYDFVNGQYSILLDELAPSGEEILPDGTVQGGGLNWGPLVEIGYISETAFNYPSTYVPFPASGLTLSFTSAPFLGGSNTFILPDLGDNSVGNWQVSWTLTPVLDLDLIVTIPAYTTWRPTGGATENDTGMDPSGSGGLNFLSIQAQLVIKSTGAPAPSSPDQITFTLVTPSREPGVAMNWPPADQLVNPSPPDLNFDKSVNKTFNVNGDGTQATFTPPNGSPLGSTVPLTISLSPHDWGGWATLNVTATAAGQLINGHFQGDPTTNILLPKRQIGSNVADIWKTQHNVALSTPDLDDSEPDPAGRSGCVGDGFTLYEEYRGFMENGKHIEGDPHNKDFFIVNEIGADAEPGIWLFTQLTGLTVHKDIKANEVQTTKTPLVIGGVPQQGVPRINFNTGQGAIEIAQHGVWIRSCNVNGGQTYYLQTPGITEHAKPARDQIICIQERDDPGTINPNDTHDGVITPVDAILQYDVAVAHELLHSVGVLHHGDRSDEGKSKFVFLFPTDPNNTTGKPVFQRNGQNVQILDELTGQDKADAFWQTILYNAQFCDAVFKNPGAYSSSIVYQCHTFAIAVLNPYTHDIDTTLPLDFMVGLPEGKHSGNDQCVMRYPFAQLYPQSDNNAIYYQVVDGTEPLGSGICNSPIGTGVNDPNRSIPKQHPQPRYFNARSGRGACDSWVCVNDVYAVVADSQ
jgi:hypothetical protein